MNGLVVGFAADLALGDPRRGHPVALFGSCALALERRLYADSRLRGAVFAVALVAGAALLGRRAGLAAVTWAALGGRSLGREATTLATHLGRGDMAAARATLPALCGRDPQALDEAALARAAVESVAENTSDAVVAPLFWGAVAGPAGVAAYRAANTLDAMVGHRSDRYARFGWAAARLDDAMNWVPARIGAALAVLAAPVVGGSMREALATLRRDGAKHPSPNAGQLEAAFAGALGLTLGGPLTYAGRREDRPRLGEGREACAEDVARAVRLSRVVGMAALAIGVLR